jgi:putative copper resistance protein D
MARTNAQRQGRAGSARVSFDHGDRRRAAVTHSHAIANIKDQLLVEMSHTPLALCGVAAGWARWLELRLDGRVGQMASWLWPVAFILVGLILLDYREA